MEGQEICSGGLWPLGRPLERSGTPPGPPKSNWKRLLDGPRPPRRLVSALPGGQIPSQKKPRRVQIEVQKQSMLKIAKPCFLPTVARISMIFEVQGSLFRIKNGSKIGSESHLRRGSPQKASWRALGALLKALGVEP